MLSSADIFSHSNTRSDKPPHGLSAPYKVVLPEEIRPLNFTAIRANKDKNWLRLDNQFLKDRPNHAATHHMYVIPRTPPSNIRQWHMWIAWRDPEASWSTTLLGLLLDHNIPACEEYFRSTASHAYTQVIERALRNEREGRSTFDQPPWLSHRLHTTLNMTIDIKRQVEEGEKWLLLRGETKELLDGRFDMVKEVWNSNRELVAVAQSQWSLSNLPPKIIESIRKALLIDGDGNTISAAKL